MKTKMTKLAALHAIVEDEVSNRRRTRTSFKRVISALHVLGLEMDDIEQWLRWQGYIDADGKPHPRFMAKQ